MRAFVRLLVAVLVAVGIGIAIEGAATSSASQVVLTSFQRAAAEPSEHVDMTEVVTIPGSATQTVTEAGDQRVGDGSAEASFVLTTAGKTIDERLTSDGIYVDYGSALPLPNGATWLEISLGGLSKVLGITDATSLFSGPSADPSQMLKLLSASSTDGVKQIATTTIDGTAVTEYQTSVNLEAAAQHNGAAYAQLLKNLRRYLTSSTLEVSVWIDGQGLPRQVAYTVPEKITVSGQTLYPTTQVTLDLSQFGVSVNVTDPPSASVYEVPDSRLPTIAGLLGGS